MNPTITHILSLVLLLAALPLLAMAFHQAADARSRMKTQGGYIHLPGLSKKPAFTKCKDPHKIVGARHAAKNAPGGMLAEALRQHQAPHIHTALNSTLLSLTVIAEESLPILKPMFKRLDAFAIDYSDEFAGPADTVSVPKITAFAAAADVSSGYTLTAAAETSVDLTLNSNLGLAKSFTDAQMRKGARYVISRFSPELAKTLNVGINLTLFNLVPTDGNWTIANDVTKTAAQFTWDVLSDIGDTLDGEEASQDRTVVMHQTYRGNLRKDIKANAAFNAVPKELIDKGYIGTDIAGFKPHVWSRFSSITSVGNFKAFCFAREAFLIAAAQPFTPDADLEVVNVQDEDTGLWVQLRRWYEKTSKVWVLAGEVLMGVKAGHPGALVRVKSA